MQVTTGCLRENVNPMSVYASLCCMFKGACKSWDCLSDPSHKSGLQIQAYIFEKLKNKNMLKE